MENITLEATPRAAGRHSNRELRDAGRVPGVVYGKGHEALAVSMDRKLLGIALHKASGRTIEMTLPGEPSLHVLTREIQRHPTKHSILHIDFLSVSMTEKVRVGVSVVPEGQAPAVANNADLVMVRSLDEVEIECLPGDIPEHLVANLSTLEGVHDEVLVKQLRVPAGVKVLTDGEQVLFAITPSRAAAVEEAVEEAAPGADEVEVVKKGKKEEEEAE
ncbi:MAG: 50S ribosomal protein L25 [Nitrososphaerales archaeon]